MGRDTKRVGCAAELAVMLFLKQRGFSIAIPFGDHDPYDIIVESPSGHLYRIQVRNLKWKKNGSAEIRLYQVIHGRPKPCDLSRIDVFACWDGEDVYFIPVVALQGKKASFTIRKLPAGGGQKVNVNHSSEFLGAVQFLT